MLEGKDHAAKIFDTMPIARRACKPLQDQVPVPLPYHKLVRALLEGSAFCFDTEDGHARFLKQLRHDTSNKAFLAFSEDRNFIRWRHTAKSDAKPDHNPGVAAGPPVPAAPAAAPSTETFFNPAILARESNG